MLWGNLYLVREESVGSRLLDKETHQDKIFRV